MAKSEFSEMISVRMDSKLYKALAEAAKQDFITVAQYVRKLIREATTGDKK